jgi:hypothetical protein
MQYRFFGFFVCQKVRFKGLQTGIHVKNSFLIFYHFVGKNDLCVGFIHLVLVVGKCAVKGVAGTYFGYHFWGFLGQLGL